ncbi:hypothetical protein HYR54_11940 [Candidatus Acetothermia bacterium]|nr:hypothetical protein [Candidatus Acetothermia bacterium]MBI3461137.1 hypothetical protein [Candidatus Acetothermia bacterium]
MLDISFNESAETTLTGNHSTFPFHALHRGMFYQYKKVEVRYLDRPADFLVLTVISRFFN